MDKREALSKTMAYCAGRESTEHEIRGKLKSWEVNAHDIEDILVQLKKEKFVDDLRYVSAFVRDKVRLNEWGKVKIRYMLSGKGIAPAILAQALEGIDEQEYTNILQSILEKKARTLKNETNPRSRKQKLINFALGRGFEMDLILKLTAAGSGTK